MNTEFRFAGEQDVSLIFNFIKALAEYEKMSDQVIANEDLLREWIFEKQKAEVIFALENEKLQWINRVPHASTMTMTKDNITFEAIDEFTGYFMDHEPLTQIFAEYENMLNSGNDFSVDNFCKAAKKCWPQGKMAVANMIAYEFLREKMHSGTMETFVVDTPGSGKGLTAPQQRYRKK